MKTPKLYSDLLKENKITENILGEVLYSINKRAKNHRDRKREYKYSVYESSYEKEVLYEQKYYKMKKDILEKFDAIEIHKEIKYRDITKRIYSEDGYGETEYNGLNFKDFVNRYKEVKNKNHEGIQIKKFGSFIDREFGYNQVEFVDIFLGKEIRSELYYLYYKVGEFYFHNPITLEDAKESDLNINVLVDFETTGKDINDLLSTQFCKKVYDKFVSGELENI